MRTDATFWILLGLMVGLAVTVIVLWFRTRREDPPVNPGTSWPDDQVMTHYGLSWLDWADLSDERRARYRDDYRNRGL